MIEDIYNYLKLNDDIATSGQPTEAQMREIAAAGYRAVINLLPTESEYALPAEGRLVEALGMEYVHIPVIWQAPTLEDLRAFFDAMDARQGSQVFVHCAANMRVSAFMALYRMLRLSWEREKAFDDLHKIWEPEGWWGEFIEKSLTTNI